MIKNICIGMVMIICITTYAQNTHTDVYGFNKRFSGDLPEFQWLVSDDQEPLYVLLGVHSILPPDNPNNISFQVFPPQVLLLRAGSGSLELLWSWTTGAFPIDLFSAGNVQQWECRYDEDLSAFVNVVNPAHSFYSDAVQIFDETFHMTGKVASLVDPHDVAFSKMDDDTLVWKFVHGNVATVWCERYDGTVLGSFSTDLSDTIQSYIDALSCFDQFLGSQQKEYYHTNSVDVIDWTHDSILVGMSERHTNKIRFAWFIKNNNGTFHTAPAFVLGQWNDPFTDVFATNGNFTFEGGHDFRFVKRFGEQILCSYFDNNACSSDGAKDMLFTLDIKNQFITLIDSIKPVGDQSIASQGLGSARIIMRPTDSFNQLITAPRIINFGAGDGLPGGFTIDLPTGPIFVPRGFDVASIGQVNIFTDHQVTTAIDFGRIGKSLLEILVQGVQVGQVYRANAYYPDQLPIAPQVQISCNHVSDDSLELSVPDWEQVVWSTGDSSPTITVSINSQKKYLARGKTDPDMLGWLYTEPFRADDCITTGVTVSTSNSVNIFPNPTMDWITVSGVSGGDIYSVTGIRLLSFSGNRVSLRELPAGVYVIKLPDNSFKKIIKY